jgi:8-amino-7-oxononanoate synthase
VESTLNERLDLLEREGLLRTPRVVGPVRDGGDGPVAEVDGRPAIVLCSNDYLGLAGDPSLAGALAEALTRHGTGAGASRLVSGTLPVHREAEASLAAFVGLPAALLFSSGYAANVGLLSSLAGRDDVVFSDALDHASLIDGCRLSRARVVVYPHRDLEALGDLLRARRREGRLALVVTESVFSMDGVSPDLPALRALCDAHDAALVVDEAHALGVLGPAGAGLCRATGVVPDALVGTLGKAFGLSGAFVAGRAALVRWLENRARSFVFSTGAPPVLAAGALAALDLVRRADDRRARVLRHAARLRRELAAQGWVVREGDSAIVPVILGEAERAVAVSALLLERGVFVQAIRPPTVGEGTSRLRLVPTAAHTEGQIDHVVAAFADLARLAPRPSLVP